MVATQRSFRGRYGIVAGVDEAGRGPLAGPVVAAAVILDPRRPIEGLNDSKRLAAPRREALLECVCERAAAWAVGSAGVIEVDRLNVLNATMLAMCRAVQALPIEPQRVFVDGNRPPPLASAVTVVIGGDGLVPAVAAASIVAKVVRDRTMRELDRSYPGYGLATHKGYPTREHLEALRRLGPSPVHRRTFRPVAELIGRLCNTA